MPPLPQHLLQAGQVVGGGFCVSVGVQVSLPIAFRIPSCSRGKNNIEVKGTNLHQLDLSTVAGIFKRKGLVEGSDVVGDSFCEGAITELVTFYLCLFLPATMS